MGVRVPPPAILFALLLATLLGACEPDSCQPCGDGTAYLVDGYAFATSVQTRGDETVLDGFNLDGLDSAAGDDAGCRFADATAPDGRTGIDNQLGYLTALFDYESLRVVPGAFAEGLSNATGLIVIEATDGPPTSVDSGALYAWRLSGVTAGVLPATDTTVSLAGSSLAGVARQVASGISDTVVWGPYDATLQFRVGQIWTELAFERAHLRLRTTGDGERLDGYFGGLVTIPGARRFLVDIQPDKPMIGDTLDTLLPLLADTRSSPEADCDRISVGFAVTYRRVNVTP